MGDEVSRDHFTRKDYQKFQLKLDEEMDFVRSLFTHNRFDDQTRRLGYELELCLVDQTGYPAPLNKQILQKSANPLFTVELAKYNLEINGNAFSLAPDVFENIERDLTQLYAQVEKTAADYNTRVGLFGVLPSLCNEHLNAKKYMSELHRYQVLNKRLMSMRGRPVHLEIHGEEHLSIDKEDVMLEAMGTSLQIHMQVPFSEAVALYHASLWASMPMLAVAANSPLVLGKSCWQESRIAIFKQSVDTRNQQEVHDAVIPRVHFAKHYIDSWLELFEDNSYYDPILPEVIDCEPSTLHHFNLHNGTIWRWIRPILGQDGAGNYHLRLELRVAPSGPTLIDSMANMVFYIGLTEGLKQKPTELTRFPFEVLEQDFYRAARHGLEAEVSWCHGEKERMQTLLLNRLIPLSIEGLQQIGISNYDKWMDIIRERVRLAATGSDWILNFWRRKADVGALVGTYLDYAERNLPVHSWPR